MKKIVNIALCYSGLVSDRENIITHKKFAELFPNAQKVNFTAFIHTWEYKDNQNKLDYLVSKLHQCIGQNIKINVTPYDELDEILMHTDIQNLYLSDRAIKRYNKIFPGLFDADMPIINIDDYQGDIKKELLRYKFAQFYSQFKAFELVGIEPSQYDLVVRLRQDTIIDNVDPQLPMSDLFPFSHTFEEYMVRRNSSTIPSPGLRPLDYDETSDLPIVFTAFNETDSGLTRHGFNYADWCWYMFYKDFAWFMDQYGSACNFVSDMVNQYLLQQDSNQFHGVHRFLSKSLLDKNAMIYPWSAIQSSLEFA